MKIIPVIDNLGGFLVDGMANAENRRKDCRGENGLAWLKWFRNMWIIRLVTTLAVAIPFEQRGVQTNLLEVQSYCAC